MKNILFSSLILLTVACSSSGSGDDTTEPVTTPGRAALEIEVVPNPIEAKLVSGDTYDFPFAVTVREVNGVTVNIDRVSMDVLALGALPVHREEFDRAEIAKRGYPTSVRGNQEIKYAFTPRKEVTDDRIFGSVSAELRAEGTDVNGNRVTATTSVTVRR